MQINSFKNLKQSIHISPSLDNRWLARVSKPQRTHWFCSYTLSIITGRHIHTETDDI